MVCGKSTPALDRRCGDRRRLADAGTDRCHDPLGVVVPEDVLALLRLADGTVQIGT